MATIQPSGSKTQNPRAVFLLEQLYQAKEELRIAEQLPIRPAPVLAAVPPPVPLPTPRTDRRRREMSATDRFLMRLGSTFRLNIGVKVDERARFAPPLKTERQLIEADPNGRYFDAADTTKKKAEFDIRREIIFKTAPTIEQLFSEPWVAALLSRTSHHRDTFTGTRQDEYDIMVNELVQMTGLLREAVGWVDPNVAEPKIWRPELWATSFQKDLHAKADELNSMVGLDVVQFKSMEDRGLEPSSGGQVL